MNRKKIIALAMATIFAAASCTGCGSKKTSGGDAILGLTVWQTQGTEFTPVPIDPDDVVAKWLVEKSGVEISDMYGNDGGQWDQKLTRLVAGDNMPDVLMCGAWQGPAHFAKLDQLNQVWELTPEMLKEYAPNVWKRTPSEYWEKMKVNGKILGIPFNNPTCREVFPDVTDEEYDLIEEKTKTYVTDVTYLPTQYLWIRDDILKQFYPESKSYDELFALGDEKGSALNEDLLDIPIKTTEEYIDFMYKIKDANLKENNKTVYAFGYDGGDNWSALTWLGADMYGYKNHSYSATWNEKKQKIEIPLVHELVRQAAKTQNKMVNDKVIDPESLAHTNAQFKEKILNGQYAIIPIDLAGGAGAINKELEASGKTYKYRPFITQVPANEEYPAFEEQLMWNESLCLLKTLDEDEVKKVLNWINIQFSDEYEQVRFWGPEEAGLYTQTPDGKREYTDERFTRYFIDNDSGAIEDTKELKGLGGKGGYAAIIPSNSGKWDPIVMSGKIKRSGTGTWRFDKNSAHTQNIKLFPPCQIWSSVYAEVPEVVKFWSEREQWESQIKLARSAPTEQFDEKWDEAIKYINDIVNIDDLENAMTQIAKPLADELK